MRQVSLKRLSPILGLGLFILAAVVVYRQLHAYHLHEVLSHMRDIPGRWIWAAVFLTVCSYLVMTGYDLLALRYIRHPLQTGKTALASFLGYTFSNNIGLSMVAGASVRYRLYSAWGLSAVEITQVVVFCAASLWLGFLMLSGLIFVAEPLALPQSLHWPVQTVRPAGILFICAAGGYLIACMTGKKALAIGDWRFALPSWRLALAQICIAGADWTLAGAVFYVLLPEGSSLGFWHFLEIFLIAQLGGLISQVPGGLGVFESVILLLVPAGTNNAQLAGSLVVFRCVYYLLPLIAATIALGAVEAMKRRRLWGKLHALAEDAAKTLFIPLLSLCVFASGAILLFSGALPALPQRLEIIQDILPLGFLEISHFMGSLAGMSLLLLARGIQRRLDAAYVVSIALLGVGIIASLLKGIDYEEAVILAVVLAVLLPNRNLFYRKASLLSERFTPGWAAAIAAVVIASIWLGLFAFRHVEYRNDLWWLFSFEAQAPRFLRATIGMISMAFCWGILHLLRAAPYKPADADLSIPESVPGIVAKSTTAASNLALLGDKHFIMDEDQQAFIMFGVAGNTWASMGDPVGPQELWPELLWRFREQAHQYADRAVFYEVGHEFLNLYVDMGLSLLKLGEEARVSLESFSLEGREKKNLRYIHNKLFKQGCSFEIMAPENVSEHMDRLKLVSDQWLQKKNTREKGFSLGFFDPAYVSRFPVGLVRFQREIKAFVNLWIGANHEEFSVDLMRHTADAPSGVMDFLFIELMLWGKAQGYRWFNLGMAPLSGMENRDMAPMWHKVGNLVARVGGHFYNFQGLRTYKDKFNPVWRPKYLAAPGGLSLPRTIADISALTSGGVKGVLFK